MEEEEKREAEAERKRKAREELGAASGDPDAKVCIVIYTDIERAVLCRAP
jgi:hypothetical protein